MDDAQRVVVCSIGTTEPYHVAGLMLDLNVFAELGVRSVSVTAGVSAQNARGVLAAQAVSPHLIRAQLAALEEAAIDAYRIGALLEEKSAECIAPELARRRRPVVYDPVAAAGAGGAFADAATFRRIAETLFPVTTIITPNLAEASMLLGAKITGLEEMKNAARALAARGVEAVLIKGGHLEGRPHDVLFSQGETHVFSDERIDAEMRGTGCLVAASLAAALAQGFALAPALARARAFVRGKMLSAHAFAGMRSAY